MSVAHCRYHVAPAQLPQHRGLFQVVDQSGQRSAPLPRPAAECLCLARNADAAAERDQALAERDEE